MKTRKFSSTLLFLLFAIGTSAYAQQNTVKHLIEEEQYSSALKELDKSPDYAGKEADKGWIYCQQGNYSQARSTFGQMLTANPKDALATAGIGACDLLEKNQSKALDEFAKAVKLNKKNLLVYQLIAKACLLVQPADTATARKYIEAGMSINEKAAPLHALQGDLLVAMQKYGEAANSYQRALFYDKNDFNSQRKIGVVYTTARHYALASEAFQKSLDTNPNGILIHRNLGDLYYMFGKYADAEKAYKTYLDKAEGITQADWERYAFTLFYTKKYKESSELIDRLMEATDKSAVLYRLKGYMAYEMDQTTEGVDYMKRFFEIQDPARVLASDYGYYARLLAKQSSDSLAVIYFEKAIQADTTSNEYLEDLAKQYSTGKQHEKAIDMYYRMIRNGADASAMNFNIGREYYFMSDNLTREYTALVQEDAAKAQSVEAIALKSQTDSCLVKSQNAFLEVQKLSPTYAGGYIWCGRVQSLLDPEALKTDAKQSYEKALEYLQQGDVQRNKRMIVECLKYLGSYYYLASERVPANEAIALKTTSIDYFSKVLEIIPDDAQAKEVIDKLKI
ncbi:MAG: tetratricopeptide repeat protein [Breznakibacter sp.]